MLLALHTYVRSELSKFTRKWKLTNYSSMEPIEQLNLNKTKYALLTYLKFLASKK